ncbi:MAG TPA: heparinase II/III family protein [Tepidisphaeraceae bacterium]|nr:heparinase II/III family protein [Tepidisphaeraceae bacterium]
MTRMIALIVTALVATYSGAQELLPRADQLKPDRPRVLLRPKATPLAISLEQLRGQAKDKAYAEMLGRLSRVNSAQAQAMVWLMTGKQDAADKAIARMRAYRVPEKADSFEVFFKLTEFGLAYDWLCGYEKFDAAARAEVRKAVGPLVGMGLKYSGDHVFHNYTWMSAGGVAMWGLATAGEDAASTAVYEQIRGRFERELWPALRYLDGLPCEPMGYWTHYVFRPALVTVLAGQSAGEADVVRTIREKQGDWLARNLGALAYGTLPDLRFVPFGDLQSGANGGATRAVAGLLDAGVWAMGGRAGAEVSAAQALSKRIAERRGLSAYDDDTAIFWFLYGRGARPEVKPAPEVFVAGGAKGGHWIARAGGWGDDATVVGFRCADHYGDHNHWDQGGFFIWRRGLLAVDPPVYKQTRGPQQRTDLHNTLLIGGQAQRAVRGQTFGSVGKFEQNLKAGKRLETGDLVVSPGPAMAAAGQFAQAYDVPALASCVRQVALVGSGTVVVVDRLTAGAGKRVPDVQWLLQFPAAPTSADGGWLATNGAGWIRCRAVLGDAGKAAAVDATEVGTQRLTLDYKGGGDEVCLVHVLEVGDGRAPAGGAQPVSARRADGGVEVTVGRAVYRFATAAPYEVVRAAADARR